MSNKSISDTEALRRAWQRHNHEHFLYFRGLSLYTKLEAVEGMADMVRRFEALQARRKTRPPSDNGGQ